MDVHPAFSILGRSPCKVSCKYA